MVINITAVHAFIKRKLGHFWNTKSRNFKCYTECYYNSYMCQGEGHSRMQLTKFGVGIRDETMRKGEKSGIKLCLTSS